jgi:hypothetical protein
MDAIVIIAIAGIIYTNELISQTTFLIISAAAYIWIFIGPLLYFKFSILKFYYHDLFKWHLPDKSPQHYDGCSMHAKCRHCGREIMQDSQGNWF